jgi:hypothetical protein
MNERYDKSEDFTSFWDEVLGEDTLSSYDIEQIRSHIYQYPFDNPRPEIIGDFDDDLPF